MRRGRPGATTARLEAHPPSLPEAAGAAMVCAMQIRIPAVALAALALALSACSGNEKAEASKDVARFLDAVRLGDRTAFNAGLNRPEVRSDLRQQVSELARLKGVEVDGGPSEFAI